jgi:hypothetical protein
MYKVELRDSMGRERANDLPSIEEYREESFLSHSTRKVVRVTRRDDSLSGHAGVSGRACKKRQNKREGRLGNSV